MSKAFTKDEAWEEPIIPPRAPMPVGVHNYVTPRGLRLLQEELAALETERHRLDGERADEVEYRRRLAILAGRTRDLIARIASATVVDPRRQPRDEVRFGARVTLQTVGVIARATNGAWRSSASTRRMPPTAGWRSPRRSRGRFSGVESGTAWRSTRHAARITSR
jgi:hypothetical protein